MPLLRLIILLASLTAAQVSASVVVLNNRATLPIKVTVRLGETAVQADLAPGDSRPFFARSAPRVEFETNRGPIRQPLTLGNAYYFAKDASNHLVLRRIQLGNAPAHAVQLPVTAPSQEARQNLRLLVCVDEEEPMRLVRWQHRLTQRVAAASRVLEQHAGISVRIEGFGRWESDNRVRGFAESLTEFEREVSPPVGMIAVGFTSQFELSRSNRRRLGGTRGPLRSHLLLREWSPRLTESERLEALVHELGHYLGAVHSPEPRSVMRPVLGDPQTRLKAYQIRFDPINTLVIATVGQELRTHHVLHFDRLTPSSRNVLLRAYATLAEALPNDPAAKSMLARAAKGEGVAPTLGDQPLLVQTLQAIATAATVNRRLPRKRAAIEQGPTRAEGDELANLVIRTAAKTPLEPKESRTSGSVFLVAVGLAIDDTHTLLQHSKVKGFLKDSGVSTTPQIPWNTLGVPTARGRNDTLKHFCVSAALRAILGAKEVNMLGYVKEAFDAQGGSGFSYADLAADRAGVRFAERVLDGSLPLTALADRFDTRHFIPPLDDLPEGLGQDAYLDQFGGLGDPRHEAQIREVDARIDALPPYAPLRIELP